MKSHSISHSVISSVLALMILQFTACSKDDDSPTGPDPGSIPPCGRLLVVVTDWATGSLSVVDADSSLSIRTDLASIHGDAVARVHEGLVYVVNRLGGDNIQVCDPAVGFETVLQFSVGSGSNPHDIAFIAADRAYVSRNGMASLLEVDPQTGEIRAEISLAGFADADGNPDMDRLYYRAPYLYIGIQRIDFGGGTYAPVPPSYLAVLDVRDNSLVDVNSEMEGIQGILLAGLNPSAPMVWDAASSLLLVPEAGAFGVRDGGVERVDLDARRSTGFLAREDELGGDLLDFAGAVRDRGYAIVSGDDGRTSLVAFNWATGRKIADLFTSDGFELSDLIIAPCGLLFVGDRDYARPGLRVFHGETGLPVEGLAQPIPTGLPPFEILILED